MRKRAAASAGLLLSARLTAPSVVSFTSAACAAMVSRDKNGMSFMV
jgi:hypothetical protein